MKNEAEQYIEETIEDAKKIIQLLEYAINELKLDKKGDLVNIVTFIGCLKGYILMDAQKDGVEIIKEALNRLKH